MRGLLWLFLILIGAVIIIWELLASTAQGIVVATVLAIGVSYVLVAKVDFYLFGIARHARHHFGRHWNRLIDLTKAIPKRDLYDIYQALQRLQIEQQMPSPIGIVLSPQYSNEDNEDDESSVNPRHQSLAGIFRENPYVEALRYKTLSVHTPTPQRIAENAVFFLFLEPAQPESAFAALLQGQTLTIAAKTEEAAQKVMLFLDKTAHESSVYRGHVLSVKSHKKGYQIEFLSPAEVVREQLILPAQTLEVLEHNVLRVLKHAQALKASRQNLQHGVLLYGPPGTGKSLAVRYLMTVAKPITVVNVTGRQLRLIRESCRLARLLAPSLIVLEDIDLIATDRAQSQRTMLLHDLLDEMDVGTHHAPVIYLMTTNRPEVLERALSLRPGRINQAVHFSLPDEECRLRLFQRFLQNSDSSQLDLPAMVFRSHGTSAAFIEEWIRRALLFAIDRQTDETIPIQITREDVEAAIHEIIESGGELTRKLLGYESLSKP